MRKNATSNGNLTEILKDAGCNEELEQQRIALQKAEQTDELLRLLAKGARSIQGSFFLANPCEMTDEDCAGVFEKSIANQKEM